MSENPELLFEPQNYNTFCAAKADELASAVGAQFVPWASLQSTSVRADVLANTTSVGMQPNVSESPIPRGALGGYKAVFDAVYTPMETQLLKNARAEGATPVSGVEMFVGQAADQFELFTGGEGEGIESQPMITKQ